MTMRLERDPPNPDIPMDAPVRNTFDRALYHSQVWVEHPTLGFAPGQIVKDESGDKDDGIVVVEACDGQICRVKKSSCAPVHPNSLQGVPDLLELGEFSLAALLHNIRVRYEKGEYYSSIGLPILISVNPYKPLPHLYDACTRKRYQSAQFLLSSPPSSARHPSSGRSSQESNSDSKSAAGGDAGASKQAPLLFIDHPHLFGTAQMTYTSLVNNNQAQSIVVSGESGAGKTEATKILLRYFSELDDSVTHSVRSPTKASPFTPPRLTSSGGRLRSPLSSSFPAKMEETPVELHALRANPILEAFGNAKTVRNDNSSRFGKFIQIWFEKRNMKRIRSARISHYLLEKCRLVSLHEHERNFHVFYALVYGAQNVHPEKLQKWGIDIASGVKLKILGNDHRETLNVQKETETFQELETCLLSTGFSQEEVDGVFELIAAIMLLYELQFQTIGGQAAQKAHCSGQQPLVTLSCDKAVLGKIIELLQLENIPGESRGSNPFDAVMELFQYKIIHDREKAGTWIYSQRDVSAAVHVRDAIIKEFYSRLFDWLVKKINRTLCFKEEAEKERSIADQATRKMSSMLGEIPLPRTSGGGGRSGGGSYAPNRLTPRGGDGATPAIGLLDIYGFEVFEGRNSFEQLCINFANEKLQQHFNHHVLSLEQKIYHNEGIDWSDILFTDNQHVIDALENSVYGVFVLLDSGCVLKGTDSWVLQEIERQGRKDVVFLPSIKNFRPRSFVVRHYAGAVEYNVDGFVEKNQDRLSSECTYFLQKATLHPIVQQLFSVDSIAPPRRYNLTATVSQSFRCQLDDLLASLTKTTPTYVRCIKPNGEKAPHKFESIDCLRQLKYAGLLESIRIRNSGFGVRCTFEEFLSKYAILKKEVLAAWHKCCRTDPSLRAEKAAWCHEILSDVLPSTVELLQRRIRPISGRALPPKPIPKRAWQLGQTRVFMKEEVQIHLEKERAIKFFQVVVRIQSIFRGFSARVAYEETKRCVVVIQSYIRMHFARSEYRMLKAKRDREIAAANTLKRLWKGLRCRKRFLELRQAARIIGDWYSFHLWLTFWRTQLANKGPSDEEVEPVTSGESATAAPIKPKGIPTPPVGGEQDLEPASLETACSLPKKPEVARQVTSSTAKAHKSRHTSPGTQRLGSSSSSEEGSSDTDRCGTDEDDSLEHWGGKERHSSKKSRNYKRKKDGRSSKSRYKNSTSWALRTGHLKLPEFAGAATSRERRREQYTGMAAVIGELIAKKDRMMEEASRLKEENSKLRQMIAEKEALEDKLIDEKNQLQERFSNVCARCIEGERKAHETMEIMNTKLCALQESRFQCGQIFQRLNDLYAETCMNQSGGCRDISELLRVIMRCCAEANQIAAREDLLMQKHLLNYPDSDYWDVGFKGPTSQNMSLPPLSSSSGLSGVLPPCPGSSSRHLYHYPPPDSSPYWKDTSLDGYYGSNYRPCYAHIPTSSNLMSPDHDLIAPVSSAMRVHGSGSVTGMRPCDQQSSTGNGSARLQYSNNSPSDLYARHSKRFLNASAGAAAGCVDLSSLSSNRGGRHEPPFPVDNNSQSVGSPRAKCHERGQSCTVDTVKTYRDFPHHRPHQLSADDCDNAACVCMPGGGTDSNVAYRRLNHHSLQRTPGTGFSSKPPKSARQTPTHRTSTSLRLSAARNEVESTFSTGSQAAEDLRQGSTIRMSPARQQSRRLKYEGGSDSGSCKAVGPAGSPSSRATQTAGAPYMQMSGRPLGSASGADTDSYSKLSRLSVQRNGIHGAALLELDEGASSSSPNGDDVGVQTPRIPFFQYLPFNE